MTRTSYSRTWSVLAAFALFSCGGDDGAPVDDTGTATSGTTAATASSDGAQIICMPGEVRCSGQTFLETCAPTGQEWVAEACGPNEVCEDCDEGDTCAESRCVGPCDSEDELPSSAGCSFIANRQLHLDEKLPDGLIIANPNSELVATVHLFQVKEGTRKEEPIGDPIMLDPGELHTYEIDTDFIVGTSSMFRTGGMFRVESDVPIIAYQHAPLGKNRGNDSAMLIPESSLRRDYVVSSYSPHWEQQQGQGTPSYFEVIALEDQTSVTWKPLFADTAGNGLPIDPVDKGGMGTQLMNRFDTMRIAASANWIFEGECATYDPDDPNAMGTDISQCYDQSDVSGTVVSADKPIWVVGASRCSRVPVRDGPQNTGACDPLLELLLPLDYWGQKYVAAHAPTRADENHYWRVYGGRSDVTITTDPPQPGTPHTFAQRGEYIEIEVPNGTSFIIEGDGPFMPVQYLQSHHVGQEPVETSTPDGDPAMYQMVPVEQFLSRYVVATSVNFDLHYIQITRESGSADVVLDGDIVTGYYPVGDYEVADVLVDEGPHLVESDDSFGIVQVGYTVGESLENCPNDVDNDPGEVPACYSSYAYPGGMKQEEIFVP